MLGKPVEQTQDVERWRTIAVREADEAERRLEQAHLRVREAERVLEEARAGYEVEVACALAARAWRDRVEQGVRRAPVALTPATGRSALTAA